MNKKLYIGNLNYRTTEEELHKLFSEVGPVVSATLITDGATGRSRGFAFVEMETEEAAEEAIERLNNREVGQRTITVSEARPPKKRAPGGDRGPGGPGGGRRPGGPGGSGGGRRPGGPGGSGGGRRPGGRDRDRDRD